MKLEERNKTKYYGNVVVAKSYKNTIKSLYDEIVTLISVPHSQLPEQQRDERELITKSKAETLQTMASEYKKRNEEMTKFCNSEEIQNHLEVLQEVLMVM